MNLLLLLLLQVLNFFCQTPPLQSLPSQQDENTDHMNKKQRPASRLVKEDEEQQIVEKNLLAQIVEVHGAFSSPLAISSSSTVDVVNRTRVSQCMMTMFKNELYHPNIQEALSLYNQLNGTLHTLPDIHVLLSNASAMTQFVENVLFTSVDGGGGGGGGSSSSSSADRPPPVSFPPPPVVSPLPSDGGGGGGGGGSNNDGVIDLSGDSDSSNKDENDDDDDDGLPTVMLKANESKSEKRTRLKKELAARRKKALEDDDAFE